ncbi:cation transporter [Paenibacillus sp. sptzw28]|uniref:cation transporter n=1 Tax=Paenibacillus sp. sptzw28 TaxID=715179 RepID=UPI001C6E6B32|nr:cation transporter [Paenibacillus sp. sptzw28]QYR23627.1 cation transporter [Paenibacillus sp. sptzw28]
MEHVQLKVEGMSCGHCANSIESAVKTLGATAKVDLGSKSVSIDYDAGKISLDAIKEAIEEQGYDVV